LRRNAKFTVMTQRRTSNERAAPRERRQVSGQRLEVKVTADGRVDVFVVQTIAGLSRRHVHRLFEEGAVHINGRRARKGDRVHAGDVVTVEQATGPTEIRGEPELPVRVLCQDDAVVAVDKPSGMPSVAQNAGDSGTVANFLVARFPDLRRASPRPFDAGLVHRLDTATSGVLLAARSQQVYLALRRTFGHTATKDYVALVRGAGLPHGRITTPIGHVPRRSRRMRAYSDPTVARQVSARRADTAYRVVQSDPQGALLAVRIRSGVRHQIRVHLASIRRPVVGDDLYGPATPGTDREPRLLLHAYRLRLPHPTREAALDIVAELRGEFAAALSARGWRQPQPSDWDGL
jgi:23S rRNA pseudouridine1911/1915/1917 synthase